MSYHEAVFRISRNICRWWSSVRSIDRTHFVRETENDPYMKRHLSSGHTHTHTHTHTCTCCCCRLEIRVDGLNDRTTDRPHPESCKFIRSSVGCSDSLCAAFSLRGGRPTSCVRYRLVGRSVGLVACSGSMCSLLVVAKLRDLFFLWLSHALLSVLLSALCMDGWMDEVHTTYDISFGGEQDLEQLTNRFTHALLFRRRRRSNRFKVLEATDSDWDDQQNADHCKGKRRSKNLPTHDDAARRLQRNETNSDTIESWIRSLKFVIDFRNLFWQSPNFVSRDRKELFGNTWINHGRNAKILCCVYLYRSVRSSKSPRSEPWMEERIAHRKLISRSSNVTES